MRSTHSLLVALSSLFAFGCALDFSFGELELQEFDRDPDEVTVDGASETVTCELTIVPQGVRTVQFAICSFVSPAGRKAGCLANSHITNVWSCDAIIPADTEDNTWTIEYVFAQDDEGGKFFITGAELVADTEGVLAGDATRVDLTVTSPGEDLEAPELVDFTVAPVSIAPGGTVTCTIQATDLSPILLRGCTFLPDDSSRSVSCSEYSDVCDIVIPPTADAGVTYTEVNHFARDESLNVSIGNRGRSFDTSAGGSGGAGGAGGAGGLATPFASIHAGTGGGLSTLYDACGDVIVPIGMNHHGFIGSFPSGPIDTDLDGSGFAEIAKTKANAVKIAWGSPAAATGHEPYNHPHESEAHLFPGGAFAWTGTGSLDTQVQAAIDAGLIPIITMYDAIGTNSVQDIANVVAFLTAPAQSAWFHGTDANGVPRHEYIILYFSLEPNFTDPNAYRDSMNDAIIALRAEGYTFPLVIGGNAWGSDAGSLATAFPTWLATDIAALGGPANLIGAWHTYSALTTGEITTAMNTLDGIGAPMMLAEFSTGRYDNAESYPTDCGGPNQEYEALIAGANARGFGWFPWSWGDDPDGVNANHFWNNDFNLGCWALDFTEFETCASLQREGCDVAITDADSIANTAVRSEYLIDRCGTETTRPAAGACGDSCPIGAGGTGGAGYPPDCTGYAADMTYSDDGPGWDTAVLQTAYDLTLTWEFAVRLNDSSEPHDAGIAVASIPITTWDDAWAKVRLSGGAGTNVEVSAYDSSSGGGQYTCGVGGVGGTCPTVTTDAWHRIRVTANIVTATFDVDIEEECTGGYVSLATDFPFDPIATTQDDAEYVNIWEVQGDTLELKDVSWTGTSGVCTPDTCNGPPLECGTPDDGCGTPLACGDTCTPVTETCYPEGTCCTLATCSVGACGTAFDDTCGGTLDCDTELGTCDARTSGDVCYNDTCCTPGIFADVCTTPGYDCGDVSDGCGDVISCGTCLGQDQCVLNVCSSQPTYFWASTEQTDDDDPMEDNPWGYSRAQCEHPIDVGVTCSDANGSNISRVANPIAGGGYALRHYAELNGAGEGARSQVGIWRGWDDDWNDAVTSGATVYLAEDLYFPEEFVGTGQWPWYAFFDMHAVDSGGGNRWYGNPGFFIEPEFTNPPWDMAVAMGWENGPSGILSVPLPVGEWFTLEFSFRWSTSPNVTSQVWINGELVLTLNNIQTAAGNHVYAEYYSKSYGDDNAQPDGDWSVSPVITYRRNMRASYSPITH